VRLRALQILFAAAVLASGLGLIYGALSTGPRYAIKFSDVDGRALSTADGHVTVLVLTTKEDLTHARAVGDNIPDYCLGNEKYRMITVLRLIKRRTQLGRAVAMMLMRRWVDEAARRLQMRYNEKKISRPARRDVYCVADFDGAIAAELGAQPDETRFHVFIFGPDGELLQQWGNVPSAEELTAALK
jgi:hypothetical protein